MPTCTRQIPWGLWCLLVHYGSTSLTRQLTAQTRCFKNYEYITRTAVAPWDAGRMSFHHEVDFTFCIFNGLSIDIAYIAPSRSSGPPGVTKHQPAVSPAFRRTYGNSSLQHVLLYVRRVKCPLGRRQACICMRSESSRWDAATHAFRVQHSSVELHIRRFPSLGEIGLLIRMIYLVLP